MTISNAPCIALAMAFSADLWGRNLRPFRVDWDAEAVAELLKLGDSSPAVRICGDEQWTRPITSQA